MLETVCAFANTEGGWLVVRVADPKDAPAGSPPQQRLWGVQENPEAFDELQRKCHTHFNPPVGTITFYRLPCTLHAARRQRRPGGQVALVRGGQERARAFGGGWRHLGAWRRQQPAAGGQRDHRVVIPAR